jgi:outer membrane murein-binding lipoprotein Lpp
MDEELKKFIESTAVETRRHFDVVAERLESRIEIVAEGVLSNSERIGRLDAKVDHLGSKVDHLDAKVDHLDTKAIHLDSKVDQLDRRVGQLDSKVDQLSANMKTEFSDIRSMIKFSHAELDRRLRTVEDVVANLQARVERLETSTP